MTTQNSAFDLAVSSITEGDWVSLAKLLAEHPEVVHLKDEFNRTLILFASETPGSYDAIHKLVQVGSELDLVASDGATVITNLIDIHNPLGLDTLRELKLVLSAGADVNIVGPSGYPPLHWAIYHNRIDHARLLLEYGADPFKKTHDFYPENAFDIAKAEGNFKAIDLLGDQRDQSH